MECGPGEAEPATAGSQRGISLGVLAIPFAAAAGTVAAGWPSAFESLAEASSTSGSKARGRGGRIRIDAPVIDNAATTCPDASCTGPVTETAPAYTSSAVSR